MRGQIEKALGRLDKMNARDRVGFEAILRKYVAGEMELAEAYAELLDEELIPMPSRCGLTAKVAGGDEEELKKKIAKKIAEKIG